MYLCVKININMRLNEFTMGDRVRIAKEFTDWACRKLGINTPPPIKYSLNRGKVLKNRTFGTTWPDGKIWVYIGNRNTADILRTLCHELVHFRQYELGTAHTSMSKEETQFIEDEANAIAGRLLRMYGKKHSEIYESAAVKLPPEISAPLPATYVIPELPNQDPYHQYRFGVAIAGAKGAHQRKKDGVRDYSHDSAWGGSEIVISSDPHIEEYIDDALAQLGLKGKRLISTKRSEESPAVNPKSPVKPFRGYPR